MHLKLHWLTRELRNILIDDENGEPKSDSTRYQKDNNLTWTNIKFELGQLIFTGRDSIIFTRQTDLVKCKLQCHSHRSPCRLQILKFIIGGIAKVKLVKKDFISNEV